MIHRRAVRDGEWDHIDPRHKDKGPVIAPLCCDNKKKILNEALRLFQVGMSEQPQNRAESIVCCIYGLLDFCGAHNIDVQQILFNQMADE